MSQQFLLEQFKKDGFIILRNIFSEDQIKKFRSFIKDKVEADFGKKQTNWKELEQKNLKDVLSYSEINEAILNKDLIDSIRHLLNGDPVYWGYSSFRWNEKAYRSFHNDAKNDNQCPFSSNYPLLRIGIYLQDHSKFSNGLKVWKGSCHTLGYGRTLLKKIFFNKGSLKYLLPQQLYSSINVDTRVGDVVVWNLRTCHSGGALRIKPFPNISFHPIIENFIEKKFPKLLIPEEKNRGVIFATFGKESEELDNFIEENTSHPELKYTIKNSNLPNNKEILEKSKKLGLKILDIEKNKNER